MNTLFLRMLMVFAIAATGSCGNEDLVRTKYDVVGYHPGARDTLGTYFVVVNVSDEADQDLHTGLKIIAKNLCAQKTVCFAHFWNDKKSAARSLPMDDQQVNTMIASYNINRNTHNDDFQCHNFGSPQQRCG